MRSQGCECHHKPHRFYEEGARHVSRRNEWLLLPQNRPVSDRSTDSGSVGRFISSLMSPAEPDLQEKQEALRKFKQKASSSDGPFDLDWRSGAISGERTMDCASAWSIF